MQLRSPGHCIDRRRAAPDGIVHVLGRPAIPAVAPDVGFGDILAILSAWGNKGGPEDLDGSGTVDFGDLLVVLSAWGPCE